MKVIVRNPKDCIVAELEAFENLVAEGGEVTLVGLRERILTAEKLVFLKTVESVAVGAIKNPISGYKTGVFKKAGVPGSAEYHYELGWLYVSETVRGQGYGRILMESIVKELSDETCFATTRADNESMQYLFGQFGFSKTGKPYKSNNGGYSLDLYTKS